MKKRQNSLIVKIGIAIVLTECVILSGIGVAYGAWLGRQPGLLQGQRLAAWLAQPEGRSLVMYGGAAGLLVILLTSLVLLYLFNALVLARLRALDEVVRQSPGGDSVARLARPCAKDEIGRLQEGINALVSHLTETTATLERQVAECAQGKARETLWLQTVLEVGRAIASIQDLDARLMAITNLISDRFNCYHVGVFLLEEGGETMALRAASNASDLPMLARPQREPVGYDSIVGRVAATREPYINLAVARDTSYLSPVDLPDTRTEIALPLSVGGQLVGVLDVQGGQGVIFTQADIEILRGVADLMAVGLGGAFWLTEMQPADDALQRVYGEVTRQDWEELLQSQGHGYVSMATGLGPASAAWSPGMLQAKQEGQIVQEDAATLLVPVKSRDEQVLGVVRFRRAERTGGWDAQQIALVETLTNRLSQALESARLYEESRRLALQERLVGTVSARIRESLEIESVLQAAVRELAEAFGLEDVVIRLGAADELLGQAQPLANSESEA
ncbi:MAG TPA: GAF domain-containing protein [Anaerolineae bacterium]|nr:GAF domain-containing protein [Anaerolineae bacterium]